MVEALQCDPELREEFLVLPSRSIARLVKESMDEGQMDENHLSWVMDVLSVHDLKLAVDVLEQIVFLYTDGVRVH